MKIIETIALITINETFFIQLGSFLLFMLLINRIMVRPLRKVMQERQSFLEKIGQDIVTADENYLSLRHQIKTQEAEAYRAAGKIRNEMELAGQHAAEAVIEETVQEIQTLRVKKMQATEAQIAAARQELQTEAQAIADRMVLALLERKDAP